MSFEPDKRTCLFARSFVFVLLWMGLDWNGSTACRKKEMVLGVVGTFKDHRSLAHTLQDSEHIARKLGLIIMWVILFILFVSLW